MKGNNKFLLFLRKNAFYFVLGFCILAVALSVTLVLVLGKDKKPVDSGEDKPPVIEPGDDDDDDKPTIEEVVFIMPVNGEVLRHYSEEPVFNSTLNVFTAHRAMDFKGAEGSDVFAVYDGKVESVTSNYLTGTKIVIDHGDGLKSIYYSLEDGDGVTVGQEVKKGDVIAKVSRTYLEELNDEAHLHFQVEENGELINPLTYLEVDDK